MTNVPYFSGEVIETPSQLIGWQRSSEPIVDFKSRVVLVGPGRHHVMKLLHPAKEAEFKEHEWIVRLGSSGEWYEKPTKALLKDLESHRAELPPLINAMPSKDDLPKLLASEAMTTPENDDVLDCVAEHRIDDGCADSGPCRQCTKAKSEALESTSLVYCLVFSANQGIDHVTHGAHPHGQKIYMLFKCGSREAAVAEAFYAVVSKRWSLAFSCVMRLDDNSEERPGPTEKVDQLWMLSEKGKTVKVFY
jgi:hypothetical protein